MGVANSSLTQLANQIREVFSGEGLTETVPTISYCVEIDQLNGIFLMNVSNVSKQTSKMKTRECQSVCPL